MGKEHEKVLNTISHPRCINQDHTETAPQLIWLVTTAQLKNAGKERKERNLHTSFGYSPQEVASACGRDNYLTVIMVALPTLVICCNVTETRERMLSDVSQTQKDKYHILNLIYRSPKH